MASTFSSEINNFIDKTSDKISEELGVSTGLSNRPTNQAPATNVPWDIKEPEEVFWTPIEIDPSRWNKFYPYRLLVVDITNPNDIKVLSSGVSSAQGEIKTNKSEQGISYLVSQTASSGAWEVVLPITPQQLQIQDQFAINTTATFRGIVEEHNGIKFKNIIAAGTTGIWPRKPTRGGEIESPSNLGSIAGGTLESFQGLGQNVQQLASSFSEDQGFNKAMKTVNPKDTPGGDFSTGYYQAQYLGQFLERYAQLKKKPENKNLRLVFDVPKQNQSFIVTPINYTFKQSKEKPNEMMFNLKLKGWKRINLDQSNPASNELPDLDPNLFQQVTQTITQTRRTLGEAINLVKAVRSDFRSAFDTLRQTSLAVKDLGGLAFSVADLPVQVIDDFNDAIVDSWKNISTAFNRGPDQKFGNAGASSGVVLKNPLSGEETSSQSKAGAVINHVLNKDKINEGLSQDAVKNGALGENAAQRQETDPLKNVFDNPEENFDLFNEISVDDLNLTPEQQDAVDDEVARVRLLTIDDFRNFRQELLNLALDISNNFGSGNNTYSQIYSRPDPRDRALPLTIEENEILESIFEAVQSYDLLTSTKQLDDLDQENPLEYVGGLANEAGIDFEDFTSKYLVPVPFGLTIEEIAARYLEDANKWIEIATLNDLQSPYIDEDGFEYNFLSNGSGRQFTVNDVDDRIFVGQKITLQSDTIPPFTRSVIDVEEIGPGNFLVTVDGLADLDRLTTNDNAKMKGYLPGTVNSQNQIYIPSNEPAPEDDRTFRVDHLDEPNLTKLSKVDFLLTEDYDVAINSVGDFRLANGLNNLIQALKLKIRTKKGTLLRHLDYGLGLQHGISVADIEDGEIIKSLNQMIEGDERFQSIGDINIKLVGSTLSVYMTVVLPGNNGIVPITFDAPINNTT